MAIVGVSASTRRSEPHCNSIRWSVCARPAMAAVAVARSGKASRPFTAMKNDGLSAKARSQAPGPVLVTSSATAVMNARTSASTVETTAAVRGGSPPDAGTHAALIAVAQRRTADRIGATIPAARRDGAVRAPAPVSAGSSSRCTSSGRRAELRGVAPVRGRLPARLPLAYRVARKRASRKLPTSTRLRGARESSRRCRFPRTIS